MDKLDEHCYKFNCPVHAEQTSKTCPSNSVTDFYINCISQLITRNHEFSTLWQFYSIKKTIFKLVLSSSFILEIVQRGNYSWPISIRQCDTVQLNSKHSVVSLSIVQFWRRCYIWFSEKLWNSEFVGDFLAYWPPKIVYLISNSIRSWREILKVMRRVFKLIFQRWHS